MVGSHEAVLSQNGQMVAATVGQTDRGETGQVASLGSFWEGTVLGNVYTGWLAGWLIMRCVNLI